MNCKNCNEVLENDAHFCDNCGARVIRQRITLKFLIEELFANVLGLDNKYFVTLKKMLLSPQEVLHEYLSGVRKRYVNPFAFFAIGAAISLFAFNLFDKEYVDLSMQSYSTPEAINKTLIPNYDKLTKEKRLEIEENQKASQEKMAVFMVKYFNILAFLMLPIYAFIAFLTYRRPYNFGEHIIINSYIQGVTFIITSLLFLISVIVKSNILGYTILSTVLVYLYSYHKLYKISFVKSIFMLLKFILITVTLFVLITIFSVLIGYVFGRFF